MKSDDFARAVRVADRLEADIGLTHVMRLERAAWLLNLGRIAEAERELAEMIKVAPSDARARALLKNAGMTAKQAAL